MSESLHSSICECCVVGRLPTSACPPAGFSPSLIYINNQLAGTVFFFTMLSCLTLTRDHKCVSDAGSYIRVFFRSLSFLNMLNIPPSCMLQIANLFLFHHSMICLQLCPHPQCDRIERNSMQVIYYLFLKR